MNPLFSLGSTQPLSEEDLWEPTPSNKSAAISESVEKAWDKQLETKTPSFTKALINGNKHWIWQLSICQFIQLFTEFSAPIVMGYFIDWFSDPQNENLPKILNVDADGYIWALLFSIVSFLDVFTRAPIFYLRQIKGYTQITISDFDKSIQVII